MSIGSMSRQETVQGDYLIAVVVAVTQEETKKHGEAVIRIEQLHGDATITPDADLPTALFFNNNLPDSFGTFDVGDKVVIEFLQGNQAAPVIIGTVFDLESVTASVPEYAEKYGSIKGMHSKKLKASMFFNEMDGQVVIRFLDGASFVVTKDSITQTAGSATINTSGATTIKADGDVTCTAGGKALFKGADVTVQASGTLNLKASQIMEN